MRLIYSFKYTKDNELKDGAIEALSADDAAKKIKRIGVVPDKIVMDPLLTISYQISDVFSHKDLIRLYNTIGNRINMGKSLIDGLEAAGDFMFDKRLKFATLLMAQQLRNGNKIYEAMLNAGFSKIDAMVIRSSEASGKQSEAFIRLASEIKRKSEIINSIRNIFIMPSITVFLIYLGCLSAPYFFGINTEKQLESLDIKPEGFSFYFDVAHFSHDNTVMYVALAALPLILLVYLFKMRIISHWMDNWKLWKNISVKSDMANAWVSFSQLWDSGVTPENCAEMTMESCEREDSKLFFMNLKKQLSQGKKVDVAVSQSGFPLFVKKGVKAAEEGASYSFPDGINQMCNEASQDVVAMVELLKTWFTMISVIVGGIGILTFFYIALGPVYLTVLQNM